MDERATDTRKHFGDSVVDSTEKRRAMKSVTDHKYISNTCHDRGCQFAVLNREIAESSNYICDDEVFPQYAKFANGRSVKIAFRDDGRPFLMISTENE